MRPDTMPPEGWLGDFSAVALMMTMLLKGFACAGILRRFGELDAHVARHTAQPAFQQARPFQFVSFKESVARYERAA